MLFSYTYVPHRMEKMQAFIDFIFLDVWCKAPVGLAFHVDLFDGDADLQEVMTEFGFSAKAPERGKAFYKDVKSIYESFAALSAAQVDQLRQWYQANNEIEKICAKDPTTSPARYADIAARHHVLAKQLEAFFKGLYSNDLLGLAALRDKIGDIKDHYRTFMAANKKGTCPFCGITGLLGVYHKKREAYDHYLPKAHYPFNSINFKNLVPACHRCNSSYKTSNDPTYVPKDPVLGAHRRAAFYPYSVLPYAIQVQIALRHSDVEKLKPADISLQFGPAAITEEIDTWKDVYGIDERYKAKLCEEDGGKEWLTQMLDEWKEDGRDPDEYLKTLARHTQRRPYADCNFLKKAFLEGFRATGPIGWGMQSAHATASRGR